MPRASNTDFLDPGELNEDALSSHSVTAVRFEALSEKLVRERSLDAAFLPSDAPCKFLFETVKEAESGCPSGVRQVCLHPNHQKARKLWGELVLLTDRLEAVIDEMQTWAEHEAGIRGSRKIIKPVNPMAMAGKVDKLHEQLANIRHMLTLDIIKATRNFSDEEEFTSSNGVDDEIEG